MNHLQYTTGRENTQKNRKPNHNLQKQNFVEEPQGERKVTAVFYNQIQSITVKFWGEDELHDPNKEIFFYVEVEFVGKGYCSMIMRVDQQNNYIVHPGKVVSAELGMHVRYILSQNHLERVKQAIKEFLRYVRTKIDE